MFKQLLAIDVKDRIENFSERMKQFSMLPPVAVLSQEEALASAEKTAIDGIVVSIQQAVSIELLKAFPNVRSICVLGTSIKKLPKDYCDEHGIAIANITEYCDFDTAEWVMYRALEFFRTRSQPQSAANKTMGLIGMGAVAHEVLSLAKSFHMKIAFNTNRPRPELINVDVSALSKEEIFAEAHIVSIHTPAFSPWLTKDILRHAREGLCIINTCMGKIARDEDLEEFLKLRPDVSVIMDKVAGLSYPDLKHAKITSDSAFSTIDSQAKLIDKFFANLSALTR